MKKNVYTIISNMKNDISQLFNNVESKHTAIVFDTSAFYNLYRFSSDYANFAIECIYKIIDYMIIPSTIDIEFNSKNTSEYHKSKNRLNNIFNLIENSLKQTQQKLLKLCDELEKYKYAESDKLRKMIVEHYDRIKEEYSIYFNERNKYHKIVELWETDKVKEIFESISKMKSLTQKEIYRLSDEGLERFSKQVPPGFKDFKKKNNLRKYDDFFIWKEMISYSKENKVDVIYVSDDIKIDWKDSSGNFKEDLYIDFNKETGKDIYVFESKDFYSQIANNYSIDMECIEDQAINKLDDDYIRRIETDVLYDIENEFIHNFEDYISNSNIEMGTEGFSNVEIDDWDLVYSERIKEDDNEILYALAYNVSIFAVTHDYYGRDDDTKEIIESPDIDLNINGEIIVIVSRKLVDSNLSNDDKYHFEEINDASLNQIERHNHADDDYIEDFD